LSQAAEDGRIMAVTIIPSVRSDESVIVDQRQPASWYHRGCGAVRRNKRLGDAAG